MIAGCLDRPQFSPTAFNPPRLADLDILRGVGLAVSLVVILVAPLVLSAMALMNG